MASLSEIDWVDDDDLPNVSSDEPNAFCIGFRRFKLNSKKVRPTTDMPMGLVPFDFKDRLHYLADEGHEIIHVDWADNARVDKRIADLDSTELAQKVLDELDACIDEYLSTTSDAGGDVFVRYKTWTLEVAMAIMASAANRKSTDMNVLLEPEEPRAVFDFLPKLIESSTRAVVELTKSSETCLNVVKKLA